MRSGPWMPRLLGFDGLGLGLRCQQARLTSKIVHPACEALNTGSPSKMFFSGLDAGGLQDDFDPPSAAALISGPGLRPVVSTAHEAPPALTSAAARVSPLDARPDLLSLGLVLLCKRARIPSVFLHRAPLTRWNTKFQYRLCFSCCCWCGHCFSKGFQYHLFFCYCC